MNPENVRSGASQTHRATRRAGPSVGTVRRGGQWAGAVRAAGGEGAASEPKFLAEGDEAALDLAVTIPHVCKQAKNHQTVCFKRVNFMLFDLYLNF